MLPSSVVFTADSLPLHLGTVEVVHLVVQSTGDPKCEGLNPVENCRKREKVV